MFDRRVQKFFDFGKRHDLVKLAFDFGLAHSENRAVEKNIFAPGQFGVKARSDFEQTRHAPFDADAPGRRLGDAAQNFQQRGFSRAVAPDDADDFALFDVKRHVLERPEFLLARVQIPALVFQPLHRITNRVFNDMPEAATVAHVIAEVIKLREIFDGDDGVAHK